MQTWEEHRTYRCLERSMVPLVLPHEAGCGFAAAAAADLVGGSDLLGMTIAVGVTAFLAGLRRVDAGRRESLSLWLRCACTKSGHYTACPAWVDPARQKPWKNQNA